MTVASCAALAAAVAALLWPSSGSGGPRPERAVSARATFEPPAVAFADTAAARLSVVIDNRALDPSTLHVTFPLAPLDTVGATIRRRVDRGATTTITFTAPVRCLGAACVAQGESATVSPGAASVDIERRAGGTVHVAAARAGLTVDRRVGQAAVAAARPPFRRDLEAPAASYRVPPGALTAILATVAAVLAALGGGLVAATVLASRRARRPSSGSDLARAVALVRSAEGRSADDRRRALGLVARLLARRDRALAASADDLAWSRLPPSGESATSFADEVERKVVR